MSVRNRHYDAGAALWPWLLFALACLVAMGLILLNDFHPEPVKPAEPATQITVYRTPYVDPDIVRRPARPGRLITI